MIRTAYTCNALNIRTFLQASILLPGDGRGHLQQEIATWLGVDPSSIFPMAAGRMGLYLFMKAAGIGEGDEVIVPAYTCVVVTNAVKYTGAKIVFADLAPDQVNPGIAQIVPHITPHTRLIVIPHNFGILFQGMEALKQHNPDVLIIEDAAHSVGSKFPDGQRIGTKGDAAFFSFEYSKPLTCGMGGALVVNNRALRDQVKDLYASLGVIPRKQQFQQWVTLLGHLLTSYSATSFLKSPLMRMFKVLGLLGDTSSEELSGKWPLNYPSKLSHWQSYLVASQLALFPAQEGYLAALAQRYREVLSGIPGLQLFYAPGAMMLRFPVLLPFSRYSDEGRYIMAALKENGILPGVWFDDVVHPKGSLSYCYTMGSCSLGETYADNMLNLPIGIHVKINRKQANRIRIAFSFPTLNEAFDISRRS